MHSYCSTRNLILECIIFSTVLYVFVTALLCLKYRGTRQAVATERKSANQKRTRAYYSAGLLRKLQGENVTCRGGFNTQCVSGLPSESVHCGHAGRPGIVR